MIPTVDNGSERAMNPNQAWSRFPSQALAISLIATILSSSTMSVQANEEGLYALAIHGGAGNAPGPGLRVERLSTLSDLLDRGMEMLAEGAEALDVVESIIRELEDSEWFNAGRGCVLNHQGEHELDASIMDGKSLRCGAVAGVRTAKNPISLARKVMLETNHILLSGSGADEFGIEMGLEQAEANYFITDRQRRRYLNWKTNTAARDTKPLGIQGRANHSDYFGTVGCVVLDQQGNLAAGTSTGGLMGKRWGRIGDSPIIGAGNYADNNTCAVSGTGIGEEFIRHGVASDIAARMRYTGCNLETASVQTLELLPENCGGVICVDITGQVIAKHNTPAMALALANSKGVRQVQLMPENSRP
jgi:L-asparaginase / beta-aspartyl-peptidase